jgi:hypothetical protein
LGQVLGYPGDEKNLTLSSGGKSVPVTRSEVTATVGEAAVRTRLGYETLKVEAGMGYRFEREWEFLAIDELSLELERPPRTADWQSGALWTGSSAAWSTPPARGASGWSIVTANPSTRPSMTAP